MKFTIPKTWECAPPELLQPKIDDDYLVDATFALNPQGFYEIVDCVKNDVNSLKEGVEATQRLGKTANTVKKFLQYVSTDEEAFVNNLVARLEDLTALIVGLNSSSSAANFMSLLHLYIRSHFRGPVSKIVLDHMTSLFSDTSGDEEHLHTQSGDDSDHVGDSIKSCREAIGNWQIHKTGIFAAKLADMINILVTFGFFPDLKESPLKMGPFVLFKAAAWDIQKNSASFIEMLADTFLFFIERGYAAFKTGDVSLLLYSDIEAADMDKEYATIVSALTLVETGKLDALGPEFKNDQDYEVRLTKLIALFKGKLTAETYAPARTILTNRLVVLMKVRTALCMAQKQSSIRDRPYGVLIYGASAVGKSSINAAITKVLLEHNGFPSSKENCITLNDADKFQSEYRPWHAAVTMDDFGNAKAETYSECPTNKIIDFLNNVPKAALNPNVELKGNVMIRPKLVTVTTNVKHLLAHSFSNEPASILRRFNCVLDVKLRDNCVDPETGALDPSTATGFINDCWVIQLQKVKIVRASGANRDSYEFTTILPDCSLFEALEWMKVDSAKHYAEQTKFVERVENMFDAEFCQHAYPTSECPFCNACTDDDVELEDLPDIKSFPDGYDSDDDDDYSLAPEDVPVETKLSPQSGYDPTTLENSDHNYNDLGPIPCDASSCSSDSYDDDEDLLAQIERSIISPPKAHESLQHAVARWYKKEGLSALEYVKTPFKSLFDVILAHKKEILIATCAALGMSLTLFGAIKMWKTVAITTIFGQGSAESIPIVLPTDKVSPWKKVIPILLPKTKASGTTPVIHLCDKIKNSLAHMYLYDDVAGVRKKCNIVPLKDNVWIAPKHLFEDRTYTIEVQSTRRDVLGKNFKEKIDSQSWVPCGEDFVLLRLLKGGDVPDLSKFLMPGDFDLSAKLRSYILHKDEDGLITSNIVDLLEKKDFTSAAATFPGVSYHYPTPTFPGLCMAPLIPCLTQGRILGFHLAGRTGTSYGVAGILTLFDFEIALSALNIRCPFRCHSTGEFVTRKYECEFEPNAVISPYHTSKWQQDDEDGVQPTMEVFGAHGKGTSKFVSQIRTTVISGAVDEIMDIPRLHGPPSNKCIGKHWSRDVTQIAHPKGDFVPVLLRLAKADLSAKVKHFMNNNPENMKLVHPLPKDYVLSGMDSIASYSRVDLNTSMGWPINKKKSFFMGPHERKVEGVSEAVDFYDPMFWEEVLRMEEELACGRRVHAVHRANMKDEAVKFGKNKIRIFAGCEFALTALTRKYFLSIVRLIQTNPTDFECAVGINAHGPEWAELHKYITTHGDSRMIAGDYKAFDKAVTPNLMLNSFEILIEIAIHAGYTSEQITIMRGIATEISYPLYEMDGVFIALFGSNPSGHPLTVILNNLNNQLYLRYAYYALHANDTIAVPPFAEVIALSCYGDDNVMSVSESEKIFTHTSVAEQLALIGVVYTMADKTAESVPFSDLSEISFLKRGFVWDNDIGAWVAPLEVASISKSLHNYMHRKGVETMPEEIAAQAISAANMEFFYHGRKEFERRRVQLLEVAEVSGISQMVDLPIYEDLLDRFHNRAPPGEVLKEPVVPLG
jgi:hypothetical protein